jgi:hypothetical protein
VLHNGLIVVDLIQDGDEAVVAALDAGDGRLLELLPAVLWNRNYFFTVPVPTFEKLWFRFRLLKKLWFRFRFLLLRSYGSGSGSSSISTP